MCLPGAAHTVALKRFLGPEQLNAVNSQNLLSGQSEGKASAAAANSRWGGLGGRLRASNRAATGRLTGAQRARRADNSTKI